MSHLTSDQIEKTMAKFILAFRKYEKEENESPDVLILDSFHNHELFLYALRMHDKFFGCDIYIANRENFGFEFHKKSDLDRLKGCVTHLQTINYERRKLELMGNWNPTPLDEPIPCQKLNIRQVSREALRAYQNDCIYKGVFH